MVEMEMAEENMGLMGLSPNSLLKFVSEQANPGSAVENENLVGVGPDFDA